MFRGMNAPKFVPYIEGHVGYAEVLAITNKTYECSYILIFCVDMFLCLCDKCPTLYLLCCIVNVYLRSCQTIFNNVYTILTFSEAIYERSNFAASLVLSPFFKNSSRSNRCIVISHYDFNLQFPNGK